jgi:solute carrier family 25 protein 39/40
MSEKPTITRDVPASMIAGVVTGVVVTPFDVVTRRVQTGDFSSPTRALVGLVRREGATSLFRGLAPTLLMFASTNALYFPVYEQLRSEITQTYQTSAAPLIAGSLARAFVACLSSPLEYVRTNMQSNSATSGAGGGVLVVTSRIWKSGAANMWSGLVPTLWRDVPHSAV